MIRIHYVPVLSLISLYLLYHIPTLFLYFFHHPYIIVHFVKCFYYLFDIFFWKGNAFIVQIPRAVLSHVCLTVLSQKRRYQSCYQPLARNRTCPRRLYNGC